MGNCTALTDHLGSAQVTAAEGGAASGVQRYSAFGGVRSRGGEMPTAYQYTGQLSQMEQVGLYHYGARWFDPAGAHFTQADTLIPNMYNPLDVDRYAYGRGNPLKYTDPTGHMVACDKDDWACQTHWDDPVVNEEPTWTDEEINAMTPDGGKVSLVFSMGVGVTYFL